MGQPILAGLFLYLRNMSIAIPTLIEKDIRQGKARYSTFQTGIGGQSVLKVPDNSYIIIFGYDYSPAGGGLVVGFNGSNPQLNPAPIRPFETQQISFYTGQAFHPFIHHIDVDRSGDFAENDLRNLFNINNRPIDRSTYIISNRSVAITVGLIQNFEDVTYGQIGVTQNTPIGLTYGGDTNEHIRFTPASSGLSGLNRFYQPSIEKVPNTIDYYDGGVPVPPEADNQFYVKPQPNAVSTGTGLIDPSEYLRDAFGINFANAAACNYFLNVHYALYTNQTPEELG
jgi:hypothetical protein